MKSIQAPKKKVDLLFIITIIAIVALSVVAAGIAKIEKPKIVPTPLPTEETINVNKLVISEIMTNNGGVFINSENQATDYLELYNGTDKTINLKGYGLSDRTDAVKWVFSDYSLQPGEYVVVGLTGKLQAGMNAAFKLSSKGGETVMLVNPNSKVIDAIETVALNKNNAMMRDGNGAWFVSEYGTPGYPNTQNGLTSYYESLLAPEDETVEIIVNEFLARNKGNFKNQDGVYTGFIEFINITDKPVNLSQYSLSDNTAVPFKYNFENVELAPNGIYCLYLGSQNYSKEKYLGFNFDGNNGNIVLSKQGKIVQSIEYAGLPNGVAMVRTASGEYIQSGILSPGDFNDPNGIARFQAKHLANPSDIIINEVMSDNDKYLVQNTGNYYDWIEIKNNSDQPINLSEYCFGKSINSLSTYQLPEVELQPGEFMVFMASGNTNLSNNSYKHLPFKIGSADAVYLSKNGEIIDSMYVVNLPYGYSYGRSGQDGFYYFSTPTPGAANSSGTRYMTHTPEFKTAAGVYNGVSQVSVDIKGEGSIYYTTDGSIPNQNSYRYTGPIKLSKTTVIKARAYLPGAITSNYSVATYVINENHTVPVVSVSMDESDFSYINRYAWDLEAERQAYVEMFEEGGSFSVPCSIALFGGNARGYAKKSYALRFGNEWGAKNLKYQIFKNRDNSIYKALVLRSGSTDWTEAYMRDILGTSLVDDYTDVDVQAYRIVVVYINGEYWGLYNLREKINKQFIANHYNVEPNSVNLARIDGDVQAGSKEGYDELRRFARNNNISIASNYQYLADKLDMVNLIDYWIAETYVTNNDILNCRFFQADGIDSKWRYIFYDLDYAWFNSGQNYYYSHLTNWEGIGDEVTFENDIIRNLFRNETFRNLWLERLSYNMKNTWNTTVVLNRIQEIYNVLNPEMQRNCDRWYLSYNHWVSCVDDLRSYARNRGRSYLSQTKYFFGLSDSQMRDYFGDMW